MSSPRQARKIFLINKPFQLRYSAYVVSWICVLSAIYPLVIWELFERVVQLLAKDPSAPGLVELNAARSDVLQLLIFLQIVFVGMIFLISIFTSHRIAGPLYKMNKFMRESAAGVVHWKMSFRKGDHFKELAEAYTLMMEKIHGLLGAQATAIHHSIPLIEKALNGTTGPARLELEQALQKLKGAQALVPLNTPDASATQAAGSRMAPPPTEA